MPQSGWDEPTQQVGPITGPTGVGPSLPDAGQPAPDEPADDGRQAGPPAPGLGQQGLGQPAPDEAAGNGQAGFWQPGPGQSGLGRPGSDGAAGNGQAGLGQPGFWQPGPGQSDFGQSGFGQPVSGPPDMAQMQFGGAALEAPGRPLPPAGWRPLPGPRRPVWWPMRGEVRAGLLVIVLLAVVGAGVALLWWQVAPRLGFKIVTPGNPVPVAAEQEQFFATDGWYVVFTLIVGLLATVLAWRMKRLRGPVGLIALAVGSLLGAVITWRGGLLLGPTPTAAQLQEVGTVVYPALRLRATAALMVEPLAAVVAYLLLVGFSARADLGRDDGPHSPPPRPY